MADDKILRVLAGECVWPPPIWLMRQAGRYLPEYRQTRATAGDFIALCTNPKLAAEVTLQPIRRFGFDAAILFSDILMLPWALGQDLRYLEGEGPVLAPIRDAAALDSLHPARVTGAIAPILETVQRVVDGLPEGIPLIGFAGSPFTVACYMVDGSGGGEFPETRAMAHSEPALLDRLLDLLVDQTVVYLSAQIAAGARIVMLFDSWSGLLTPFLFQRHVIERTRQIVDRINALHPGVKVIGFPRLAGLLVGAYAEGTGVDAIGLDTVASLARVRTLVPEPIALQGNLDPLALVAGGDGLAREIDGVLAATQGQPHIFNLGHGILPRTNPDHVAALVRRVRAA